MTFNFTDIVFFKMYDNCMMSYCSVSFNLEEDGEVNKEGYSYYKDYKVD